MSLTDPAPAPCGAVVSISRYLAAQGLVNGGVRWNSEEDFLTAILYTPALRRVIRFLILTQNSEFSELSGSSRVAELSSGDLWAVGRMPHPEKAYSMLLA